MGRIMEENRTPTPQLSVVIACFNGEDTLRDQLVALADQPSVAPWELIIADNGSTDGSVELARSFASRLPLRIIDASARRGPAHARNVGVAAARGEWIAFCDADDVVAPNWVAQVCGALQQHPFVAGKVDTARLNTRRIRRARHLDQASGLQPASGNRLGLPHAGAGNMALHRSVFESVGGFDEKLHCLEDTDLCWRIQLAGVPLVYEPSLLIHTRLRTTIGDNFRQGRGYGRGQTMLEERYGRLAPSTPADTPKALTSPRYGVPSPSVGQQLQQGLISVARVVRSLVTAKSLPGVAWRLGWLVGRRDHHQERERVRPLPRRHHTPALHGGSPS